tara:strand:- start:1658 stop:2479 length:822 start_codon:yes stop_codon:yes gene_type:complete
MSETSKDAIRFNIQDFLTENVSTIIPAKVIGISDFEKHQRVNVEPSINYTYPDGTILVLPPLDNVPIQYPSGGGGSITFPIAVGDMVSLHFSMYSMKEWLEGIGDQVTPMDARMFSFTDAIAIAGMNTYENNASPDPKDVEVKFNGSSFKLKSDDNGKGVELTTDANLTINCVNANVNTTNSANIVAGQEAKVTAPILTLDSITSITATTPIFTINGNLVVSGGIGGGGSGQVSTGANFVGDVTADGTSLKTHTHNYSIPEHIASTGPTGQPN